MLPYAVVADDLTGAGDTGVQFTVAGLRTRLLFGGDLLAGEADVLACSTDSRALAPEAAYERVRSAVEAARALGAREVYKKIDSTLRGNLGAELDAVLDAMPGTYALVCPAFPATGRTLVGGHMLVNGEPVSRTAIARDPATPVTESYVPALVARQSRRKVGRVDLSAVVAGPERVAAELQALAEAGVAIVVADAVSPADLECLVAATRLIQRPAVLVGAAGLAGPLAARWAAGRGAQPAQLAGPAAAGPGDGARVLAVVGSVHTAARAQLGVLAEHGMVVVKLDLAAALADDETWNRWLAGATAALASPGGPGVVLTTAGDPADVAEARRLAAARGLDPAGAPRLLARRLAALAQAAMAGAPVAGLILTGGDTAAAVLQRLGAVGLDLIGEVGPGIAAGRLAGGSVNGLPVVTKAGGFGGSDALWQAVKYLLEPGRVPA